MQDWLQAGSPSKEAERKEADESWEVVRAPPHEEEERRMREEERGVREAVARGALNVRPSLPDTPNISFSREGCPR